MSLALRSNVEANMADPVLTMLEFCKTVWSMFSACCFTCLAARGQLSSGVCAGLRADGTSGGGHGAGKLGHDRLLPLSCFELACVNCCYEHTSLSASRLSPVLWTSCVAGRTATHFASTIREDAWQSRNTPEFRICCITNNPALHAKNPQSIHQATEPHIP